MMEVDRLEVQEDLLTLYLKSTYITDDSLKQAWLGLKKSHYQTHGETLSEKLFDRCAFLLEVSPDSLEIILQGREHAKTRVHIFYDEYVQKEEAFPEIYSGGTLTVSLDSVHLASGKGKTQKEGEYTVKEIKEALYTYLTDYYKQKGSYWYNARVQTEREYAAGFTLRIRCLSNEATEFYFESIEYEVKVMLRAKAIEVQYDIRVKYASGLMCPPFRKGFYKSLDVRDPDAEKRYADKMRQKLDSFIRGYNQ